MISQQILTRIHAIEEIAENILSYTLVPENGKSLPSFSAGAHIDVMLDNGMVRQYSLCGSPGNVEEYRLAVLKDTGGRGGSEYIHQTLRQGDLLRIHKPRNHFKLDESADNFLLIAGGIGITPIMLMAMRLKELGKPFSMHYLCRTPEQAAFRNELERQLGSSIQFHYSYGDVQRRLDFQDLFKHLSVSTNVYFCGSEGLLQSVQEASRSNPLINLHFELFSSASQKNESVNGSFEVEVASTGAVLQVAQYQTILDALRENGHNIESMCEEGLCGSCEVALLEGEADHRDSVLTDEEKQEQSAVMVCCSRAVSSRLKLDL